MTQTIQYAGNTYKIEDDGSVYVIKTRRARLQCRSEGSTWRQRITSERKIRALKKLAQTKSYAPEVKTSGDTKWVGNGCRFATEDEAKAYLFDLTSRWFAVNEYRVVESNEPANYAWRGGQMVEVQ